MGRDSPLAKHRIRQWQLAALALVMLVGVVSYSLEAANSNIHAADPFTASAHVWGTYAFDAGRTGYNAAETIINPSSAGSLNLKWSISTGSFISAQPIVANGMIYWGSWDGIFHATKPNGTTAWTD